MDALDCCRVFGPGEWMHDFRTLWDRWASSLELLQPGRTVELETTHQEARALCHLILDARFQPWECTVYMTLWEQAFR